MGDDWNLPPLQRPHRWLFKIGVEAVLAQLRNISDQRRKVRLPQLIHIIIHQPRRHNSRIELRRCRSIEYLRPEHIDIAVSDLCGLHDIALGAVGEEDAFDLEQHLLVAVEGDELDY